MPEKTCAFCKAGYVPGWDVSGKWVHFGVDNDFVCLDKVDHPPPKFKCVFCEGQAQIKYYLTEATAEEVAHVLMCFGVCTKDARAVSAALTEREALEISRTVA